MTKYLRSLAAGLATAAVAAFAAPSQSQPAQDTAPAAAAAAAEGDVVVASHTDTRTVEFKIVSAAGVVAFTVPQDWGVQSMQPFPPVTISAFQAADAADAGTPDSTNFAVSIYHLDTDEGRAAMAVIGKHYGAVTPEVGSYKGWTTYASEPVQGATTYTLIDGTRAFEDQKVSVGVRCAWPHLAANAADYGARMLDACHAIMESVAGIPGPYVPAAGEVVRRLERHPAG